MVFSSIPFIFFFFPFFLIIYYLVPFKLKNIVLLIFSLIFYAWGEPIYIVLMIFSSLVDYLNGLMLKKIEDKRKRKLILIESIIVNLSLLSIFKYSDFLIENINAIFHLNINTPNLPLPIGISFFTFQTMSYTIDSYRRKIVPEKNFLNFMTYVSMFPQLIAGPIVRYEEISSELQKRKITLSNFSHGTIRFLDGLFKKVLIANVMGELFQSISSNYSSYPSSLLILGIIAYTLQIYFDFSGYSDMAIGIGKMLGFNYPENFNYPLISKSISEFWRRWHMSLSYFFRDYVYIPLGGNRKGVLITIRNILFVWFLTGLWHGDSWNFIIWGLYFGIILILEKFVFQKFLSKLPNYLKHIYTLILILISFLIFAFDDIDILLGYTKAIFNINNSFVNKTTLFFLHNYLVAFIIAITSSFPIWDIIKEKIYKLSKGGYYIIMYLWYILLFIITISYLVSDTYNPFLYFRF